MWSFLEPTNLRHKLRVAIVVSVVMTVAGPFGTYETLGLATRALYWTLAILGCALVFEIAIDLAIFVFLKSRPITVQIVAGAAAAAIPASVVMIALETTFRNGIALRSWPWLVFCVFVIGTVISVLNFHPAFAKLRPPRSRRAAPFLDRLPDDLGERLDSLSMNDHYVEAVTTEGSTMIHLRFATAMAELDAYPGLRIHRSHWVALDAVEAVEGKGRTLRVRTRAGRTLPVSETYRDALLDARERGWLASPRAAE